MARHRIATRFVLAALAVLQLIGFAPYVLAQASSQRIAAVVNEDIITNQELGDRLDLALVSSGLPGDAETRRRLAPQVLRGLIDEKLQLQEAKRLGLQVSDAEVDQALDTIAQRNSIGRDQLIRLLAQSNVNPNALRQQLRGQVAWLKVVNRELRPRVAVTQEQIELAQRGNAADGDAELLVAEILLPVYDRAQEAEVLDDARGLVASLREGADFGALARQVSASASAEAGGDLGWVRASAVLPELRQRLAAMSPGEVSDPILSPAGVHIFQLRDRRVRAVEEAGEKDRDRTRQQLMQEQLERLAQRYLRDLRRDAFIDIRL